MNEFHFYLSLTHFLSTYTQSSTVLYHENRLPTFGIFVLVSEIIYQTTGRGGALLDREHAALGPLALTVCKHKK